MLQTQGREPRGTDTIQEPSTEGEEVHRQIDSKEKQSVGGNRQCQSRNRTR